MLIYNVFMNFCFRVANRTPKKFVPLGYHFSTWFGLFFLCITLKSYFNVANKISGCSVVGIFICIVEIQRVCRDILGQDSSISWKDSAQCTLQVGLTSLQVDLDTLYPINTILISKSIFIHLKISKTMRKMKRNFTKREMIRPDALSNMETYTNR